MNNIKVSEKNLIIIFPNSGYLMHNQNFNDSLKNYCNNVRTYGALKAIIPEYLYDDLQTCFGKSKKKVETRIIPKDLEEEFNEYERRITREGGEFYEATPFLCHTFKCAWDLTTNFFKKSYNSINNEIVFKQDEVLQKFLKAWFYEGSLIETERIQKYEELENAVGLEEFEEKIIIPKKGYNYENELEEHLNKYNGVFVLPVKENYEKEAEEVEEEIEIISVPKGYSYEFNIEKLIKKYNQIN